MRELLENGTTRYWTECLYEALLFRIKIFYLTTKNTRSRFQYLTTDSLG